MTSNYLQDGEIVELDVPYTNFILVDENASFLPCKTQGPFDASASMADCTLEVGPSSFIVRYSVTCPSDDSFGFVGCPPMSTFSLLVTDGI